jgi:hypothetical protein
MKVNDLKPADYNPRKITDKKLSALKKSLDEFGDLSGVVFNVRTKTLISGHQRCKNFDASWKIVKKEHKDKTGTVALGYIETPGGRMTYREVDWPIIKEKRGNLAANNHGGDNDEILLKDLLEELKLDDPLEIELLGFDEIPFKEDPHLLLNNFTKNYGGKKDDTDHYEAQPENIGERYPITLILDKSDFEKWIKIKEAFNLKSDKLANKKDYEGNAILYFGKTPCLGKKKEVIEL